MKIFFLFIALCLSSCATAKNDKIITRAGQPPPAEFSEDYVLSLLANTLKDPESLKKFTIAPPRLLTMRRSFIDGGGLDEAWLICFRYNAKNSYGAYVGEKPGGVFFPLFPLPDFLHVRFSPAPG